MNLIGKYNTHSKFNFLGTFIFLALILLTSSLRFKSEVKLTNETDSINANANGNNGTSTAINNYNNKTYSNSTEDFPYLNLTNNNTESTELDSSNLSDLEQMRKLRNSKPQAELTTKEVLDILIEEIKDFSKRMNISVEAKEEINSQIKNIQDLSEDLNKRYNLFDIKTNYQLDSLSHKLISEIETQIVDDILRIRKQIEQLEETLMLDDIEIENYKKVLPNPNSVCNLLTNCSSCTADTQCGWCSNSNQCVEGTKDGPVEATCPFYNYQKCPEHSDCSSYSNCNSCLADVACGWCSNLNLNVNVCLNKNEAEQGLCNVNFFHHVWKKDALLSSCPIINMGNFLNYHTEGLYDSNDFNIIKRDFIYAQNITVPSFEAIQENLKALEDVLQNKLEEQIQIDRLHRENDDMQRKIDELEDELALLDEKMNLNDTVRYEIALQRLKDIEKIISVHLDHMKNGTERFINDLYKKHIDRFNKQVLAFEEMNRNRTEEMKMNFTIGVDYEKMVNVTEGNNQTGSDRNNNTNNTHNENCNLNSSLIMNTNTSSSSEVDTSTSEVHEDKPRDSFFLDKKY